MQRFKRQIPKCQNSAEPDAIATGGVKHRAHLGYCYRFILFSALLVWPTFPQTVIAEQSFLLDFSPPKQAAPIDRKESPPRPEGNEIRQRAPRSHRPPPSLEAMIGQMLLIGFDGISARDPGSKNIAIGLREGRLGGVIFMDRNVQKPKQVRELVKLFKEAGAPLSPFISADQEGGRVQRLAAEKGFTQTPDAASLARSVDPSDAYSIYYNLAREMAEYGFNLNFGPVLDLNLNPDNPIIAGRNRSFGGRADQVTAFAQAFISAHRDAGLITAVKHFPGHGSSRSDSHLRLVDLTTSWNEAELDPYRVLARRNLLDMVMVGHLFHPAFSPKGRVPATYSNVAIGKFLRRDVGFNGVVITDDLAMLAAAAGYPLRERLVRAINAGNDILLITKGPALRPGFAARAISIIREEVASGRISRQRIADSYRRILVLKRELLSRQTIYEVRTRSISKTSIHPN